MVTRFLRLVAALTVGLGVAAAATPASADAGGNTHFTQLSDSVVAQFGVPAPLPFTCAGPRTGTTSFTGTGNGVLHENDNKTGFWATVTEEGQVTLTMTPGDVYVGKLTFSVGVDANNQNMVIHATLNFQGTDTTTGTPAAIHLDLQKTTNPAGDVTATHFDINCT
jgi:hypothetical protein